jgi:DNA-directed RNA polymerase subunit alpha
MREVRRQERFKRALPVTKKTRIDDVPFSVRVTNALKNDNIVTIGELLKKTDAELKRIPNFGFVSLMEIHEFLKTAGFKLGEAQDGGA